MIIWERNLQLVKEVYSISNKLPDEEKFGLISQVRRASVSVMSNISEGEARRTVKEKRIFYEIARASIVEIDTQIEISLELNYLTQEDVLKLSRLLNECFTMLSKLKQSR